jgi:hypothetical protein
MQHGGASTWREVVERHHSALIEELSASLHTLIEQEIDQAVSRTLHEEQAKASTHLAEACRLASDTAREAAWHEAREAAHQVAQETARKEAEAARLAARSAMTSQFESLNQLLRRLRGAAENDILHLLAKGSAWYASRLVVLVFENNQARVAAHQGVYIAAENENEETPDQVISFPTSDSPAILSAIESRDRVIALSTAGEISPSLASVFNAPNQNASDRKAYLFPVVARHSVVAMLIASGVELPAALELICEVAGMRYESPASADSGGMTRAQGVKAQSMAPAPDVPASATAGPRSWGDLSLEDQKLHLQAQRMARVAVAEMRLYHQNELRGGVASSNIYGSLQGAIDTARSQFLQTFLSRSPTMVDYLHLEIMRSLAHEDDRLLGHTYPGPMV